MTACAPPHPPLEVLPPDIAPYRDGNTGTPFVTRFDSGRPGPNVVVNALTHGNEFTGAHVLCRLLEAGVRPARGRLTLAFANFEALARFNPLQPFASRYVEEDFNRIWHPHLLEGGRTTWELRRARELRPLVAEADFLLDLHSMHQGQTPLLLTGVREKSLLLARAMGFPGHVVVDRGHQQGPRLRDFGAFDDPASPAVALLVECGQHWAAATLETALRTTRRFLEQTGVVVPEALDGVLPETAPSPQRVILVEKAVTATAAGFRFAEAFTGLEEIAGEGEVIGYDGEQPVVTPFPGCVLVMPALPGTLKAGQTAVRLGRYVA